ncbi:MAG: filamentous hemagglutinin N-terminal domain-containing protein [Rhodocyclales bacterium]|nr:filamentous hemagglutinin N-terminal domain-containing protein [Rhodocyclales bacterium]
MTHRFPSRPVPFRRFTVGRRILAAAVSACFAGSVLALPTGPTVVSGAATVAQSGNVLSVTNSNGAILNWQQFGIGASETVRFVQPAASSSVLNRVVGADPSQIYGLLQSNGRVWLINPAGVMVGPGGRIDTAGFVASTLDVANQDFLAGRLNFRAAVGAGEVVNQGRIATPAGGTVYLIGTHVANEGSIATPGGETLLAAGQTVSLIDTATPGVKIEITGTAGRVTNLGEITATAGRIGMAGVVVRNAGLLNASSVVNEGGRIFLKAAKDTYVDAAGRIVATGSKGGRVEVLGQRVAVTDQASSDVSGDNGGGSVLVGGDTQGKNAEVQNAEVTYFGPAASIRADANIYGDGGKIVVWADDTARAFGAMSARGGSEDGSGGFVETSGHRYLDVSGIRVDTSAPNGQAGNWLLDPTDVTIVSGTGAGTFINGMFDNGGGASSTVYAGDISNNLASGNVTITTVSGGSAYGDMAMSAGAVIQPGSAYGSRTLSLIANRHLSIAYGAAILGNAGSPLNVVLEAGYGGSVGSVTLHGGIATRGGFATLRGAGVTIGDGIQSTNVGINATTDFLTGASATPDSAPGGRILIDAGAGTFTLASGANIGTSNQSTLLDTNGNLSASGGVAIGIKAGDAMIAGGIKLNYTTGGSAYGGGDLGFLPTSASIGLGNYGGASFTLDNAELSHLYLPAGNNTACATGAIGCRIWIGNRNATDPLLGSLPVTSQAIIVDQANFDFNNAVALPKRVHLSTTGTVNDAGTGAVGGYYGAQAGSLVVYGGSGIGSDGGDGLSFVANSANLSSYGGSIAAASVGIGNLALRKIETTGAAALTAYGAVTVLPYFTGQKTSVGGSFSLTAGGDITFAKAGQSYTLDAAASGSSPTWTETAAQTAAIEAGALNLSSQGNIAVVGDHRVAGDANLTAYGAGGISFNDAGLLALGNIAIAAPNGGLSLTGTSGGTFVKSQGTMTLAASNIFLTGGDGVNASGAIRLAGTPESFAVGGFGAGVIVTSYGAQTVTATNALVLRAGSADNASNSGNALHGGSVTLASGGGQTIAAASLALYGGAGGHDNAAAIEAYGAQVVTADAGGIAIYGGGATGSFNNFAAISQSAVASGYQKIVSRNGGNVTLVGGAGTGTPAMQFWSECGAPCQGVVSRNEARINSRGVGLAGIGIGQEFDFIGGGTLTLQGGSGGNGNEAQIDNRASSTQKIWSSSGSAYHPTIVISGGTSGGTAVFGGISYGGIGTDGVYQIANSAGISAGDEATGYGSQVIYARGVTLDGGGSGAAANAVGGAYIGGAYAGAAGYGTTVISYGSVTLTGGAGNHVGAERYSTPAAIGNDKAANVALTIYGGDLVMNGGTGATGGALIGSMEAAANIAVNVVKSAGIGGDIVLTGAGGAIAIGSAANVAGGGAGTVIDLRADGSITAGASSAAQPVTLGATDAASAATTTITLTSGTGAGSGGIAFSTYGKLLGHSLNASSGNGISLLGTNAIDGSLNLTTYGAGAAGDIALNLGSNALGSISTTTAATSAQTVAFYGGVLDLGQAIDMEGDNLALFASGSISFASAGRIFNAAGVTLHASDGIYNPYALGTAVIDTSAYGGAIALVGTEIGLAQQSDLTATGNPITLSPGTGTVSATATSGGINLYQTAGTLATGKYTLSSPAGNHVHLRSAAALDVSGALSLPDNHLLLIAQGGAVTQAAPITAASLFAGAYGGIALTDTGNRVSTFGAYNSGSGDIAYKNAAALAISDHYGIGYGVKNAAGGVALTALAGNLTAAADVTATGAIALSAAGNLTQPYGAIANDATAGSNDIAVYGADVELRNVRSQRDVNITATGALTLRSFSGTDYIDDQYFTYNLPFSFSFYGVSYSQAYISSNGLITFGSGTSAYSDSLSGLGSYKAIAPAWNDWELFVASGKDIFITRPTASSLAVTWDVDAYPRTGINAKFGAALNDNGTIRFDYGPAQGSFAGAVTIGLSNGSAASTIASQLMDQASFSLNNLKSTTFTPDGSGGYTEALSATSTPLPSTSDAFSGGNVMMGVSYSTTLAVTAARNLSIAVAGAINAYSGISAAALNAVSYGGATFSGDNQISAFSASNTGSGDVVLANRTALALGTVSNSAGNVSIANIGALTETGGITTNRLSLSSSGGAVLNGANRVADLYATNGGSGDIVLANTSNPLTISGITNTGYAGSISVDNVGGITVDGTIQAYHGGVTLTAHSPIQINSIVAAGGGSIGLSATTGITLSSSASLAASDSVSAATSSGDIVVPVGASVSVGTGKSMRFSAPGGSVHLDGDFSGADPDVVDNRPPVLADPCVINPASCIAPEPVRDEPVVVVPPVLAPVSASVYTPPPGSGTVGGGADQFGGSSSGTPSFSGSTTETSTSTAAGSSGNTTPAASEPANSSTSTDDSSKTSAADKDTGQESKDNKDKKDDKKSASSSEEKKDDKASGKKPVGKCSA